MFQGEMKRFFRDANPANVAVHRMYTHSVHDVHTVCSQARTNVNACLWIKDKMVGLCHLCACKKFHLQVSHVTPMLVVSTLFSLPVHHSTQHYLDCATLQDHTVHQQPLPQEPLQPLPEQLPSELLPANAIRSENNAKELLSDPDYESAGNVRINTPTSYEPEELTTKEIETIPMMSLEEDIYQFHDVQSEFGSEFGEQDQQAPNIEEVREFGQIEAQSLLDHEMAEMSPVEKMSYLQSQMHLDESMESIADCDLEVGEIQKVADFITV